MDDTDEHQADCDLDRVIGNLLTEPSNQQDSPARAGLDPLNDTADTETKRRKHRESMARIRQRFRTSIDSLQLEEGQLRQSLESAIANFNPQSMDDSRAKLQAAYYELVREQLAMQDEREDLTAAFACRGKYARVVQLWRDQLGLDDVRINDDGDGKDDEDGKSDSSEG